MKSTISLALLALASTAQSLVLPRTGCTKCTGFTISVSGGASGTLGQLADGQNRVGPGYKTPAKYNLGCDGGITDASGRGCILTPPTTQFQCDKGATPTKGFTVGSNGQITYNGSGTFYACPVDNNNNYNIYTKPVAGQTKCVTVTLKANGCAAPPPPPPPKTCPASTISQYNVGKFEFPHLIVPVNSASSNQAYGTQYSPHITKTQGVIYNFDIPPQDKGLTCSLIFAFPNKPLVTSDYTISGAGNFNICQKASPATEQTTYANQPKCSKDLGTIKMSPGKSYTIATFACPAGQRVGYEISSKDTDFVYFQDYNLPAIGLYIVPC